MTARICSSAIIWFCVLAIAGCPNAPTGVVDQASFQAKRRAEIETLVAQPAPSTLATAALLSFPLEDDSARPLELIQRAAAMAPQRPELVWVQGSICRRLKCGDARSIENRLQELDPDNGFAWMADLERAEGAASDEPITAAITRIGATQRMTFYWNSLEVMVFDALTFVAPKRNSSTRAIEAIGILSAQTLPPLKFLTKPCRADQFGLPGRREACEAMAKRMEHADTVITQSLALSMQERWWPVGSEQRESLKMKHRQLDYEMEMSGQIRWRMNRDMAMRMEAARKSEREEDVMLAVMRRYGIPLAAPPDWKDKREPV